MIIRTMHDLRSLVRGRRAELGLSQAEVAQRAGVSRKWLSEFERGTVAGVPLPLVLRLLAALGISLDASSGSATATPAASGGYDPIDLDELLAKQAQAGLPEGFMPVRDLQP